MVIEATDFWTGYRQHDMIDLLSNLTFESFSRESDFMVHQHPQTPCKRGDLPHPGTADIDWEGEPKTNAA